jgi:hypothetical protein
MVITRRWYAYNGTLGGQHDQSNYFFINSFPGTCTAPATNICAVLGIYEVSGSSNPSENVFYGTNPQPFVQDSRLFSYITEALANTDYAPRGAGQQPYAYKKNFA